MKKELQSKDLRIGNILINTQLYLKNKTCYVTGINKKTVWVRYKYYDQFDNEKENECSEPLHYLMYIQLSEQIIESFGLKRKRVFFDGIVFTNERFTIKLDEGFVVYFKGIFIKRIEYAHELQNLYFALTGKELELKSVTP